MVLLVQTGSAAVVGEASLEGAGTVVVEEVGRVEEGLLDLPVVLFGADGEFEVFFGDRVPVLQNCPG